MDHYNWEKNFPNDFFDLNEADLNHPHFVLRQNRINQGYGENAHILQTFPKDKYSYMPEWQSKQQSFDHRRIPRETATFRNPCSYDRCIPLQTEPYHIRRNNTGSVDSPYILPHNLRSKGKPLYYPPYKNKYEMDYYSNKQNLRRRHPYFHRDHQNLCGNHFYTQDASVQNSDFPIMQNYSYSKLPTAVWEDGRFETVDTQSFNPNASFDKLQTCNSIQRVTDCDRITCITGTNAYAPTFDTDLLKYCSPEEPTTSHTLSSTQTNDISNCPFTVEFSSETNEAIDSTNGKISTKRTTKKGVSMAYNNSLCSMDETALSVHYLQSLYLTSDAENSIPDLSSYSQLVSTDSNSENLFQEDLDVKEPNQIINNIYIDSQKRYQCSEFSSASGTILEEISDKSIEKAKNIELNLNAIDNNICSSSPEKAELFGCTACNLYDSFKNNNDLITSNDGICSTDLDKNITDVYFNKHKVVPIEQDMNLEISPSNFSPGNLDVNSFKEEWNSIENLPISLETEWNSEIPSDQTESSVINAGDPIAEEFTQTQRRYEKLESFIGSPACQVDSDFESNGFKMQCLRCKAKCKKKRKPNASRSASNATYFPVLDPEEQLNPKENSLGSLTNNIFDEITDKYNNDVSMLESLEFPEESASKISNTSSRQKVVKRRKKSVKNVNYLIESTSVQDNNGSSFIYSNILDSKISLNQIETSLSSITNYLLEEPMNFKLDDEDLEFCNLKYPLVTGLYSSKTYAFSKQSLVPRQGKMKECHLQSTSEDPFLSSASVSNSSLDLLEDVFEPSSPKHPSVDYVRKRNRRRCYSVKKRKKLTRKESKVSIIKKYDEPISNHDRSDFCLNESRPCDEDVIKINTAKVEKKEACTQIDETDLSSLIKVQCDAQTQWDLSDVNWPGFSVKSEKVDEEKTPHFSNCTEKRQLRGDVAAQKENTDCKKKIYWNLRTRQIKSCSQNKHDYVMSRASQSTECLQSEELEQECFEKRGTEEDNEKLKAIKSLIVNIKPLESEKVEVKTDENYLNLRSRERRCKKLPQKLHCQNRQ